MLTAIVCATCTCVLYSWSTAQSVPQLFQSLIQRELKFWFKLVRLFATGWWVNLLMAIFSRSIRKWMAGQNHSVCIESIQTHKRVCLYILSIEYAVRHAFDSVPNTRFLCFSQFFHLLLLLLFCTFPFELMLIHFNKKKTLYYWAPDVTDCSFHYSLLRCIKRKQRSEAHSFPYQYNYISYMHICSQLTTRCCTVYIHYLLMSENTNKNTIYKRKRHNFYFLSCEFIIGFYYL